MLCNDPIFTRQENDGVCCIPQDKIKKKVMRSACISRVVFAIIFAINSRSNWLWQFDSSLYHSNKKHFYGGPVLYCAFSSVPPQKWRWRPWQKETSFFPAEVFMFFIFMWFLPRHRRSRRCTSTFRSKHTTIQVAWPTLMDCSRGVKLVGHSASAVLSTAQTTCHKRARTRVKVVERKGRNWDWNAVLGSGLWK